MTKKRQRANDRLSRSKPLSEWGDEQPAVGDRGAPYVRLSADDAAPARLGHVAPEQKAPQCRGHSEPDPQAISSLQPGDGLSLIGGAGGARSGQGDPDPGPRLLRAGGRRDRSLPPGLR